MYRSRKALLSVAGAALGLVFGLSSRGQRLNCFVAPTESKVRHDSEGQSTTIQLADITASTHIHFNHLSAPENKYIVESMSGGVALIDYDGDGWIDIYFTNAPDVEMQLAGRKARSALFRNNRDGTFTDVTDKAGVEFPGWAMGAVVGDYNNDGWPDLLVTCLDGVVLYRNNGDGTFTDVTKQTGLNKDFGWATGAAFGDYDNDGWVIYSFRIMPSLISLTCQNLARSPRVLITTSRFNADLVGSPALPTRSTTIMATEPSLMSQRWPELLIRKAY